MGSLRKRRKAKINRTSGANASRRCVTRNGSARQAGRREMYHSRTHAGALAFVFSGVLCFAGVVNTCPSPAPRRHKGNSLLRRRPSCLQARSAGPRRLRITPLRCPLK